MARSRGQYNSSDMEQHGIVRNRIGQKWKGIHRNRCGGTALTGNGAEWRSIQSKRVYLRRSRSDSPTSDLIWVGIDARR